ncbi:putative transcriptional regulatory protein [Colletotrichum aenigma]|uniref:putative transcriptional regulatory protein n=1 Tax=Colletotrichum aenigma TaxID=1215731 RepID=UPI0018729A2A|nr:putative transcriptional regulatory protein [Colletotrichum aenigma]KAF5526975.1 putative transcriptional regulatory protein [Colletotrichum aenigma]
MNPAPDRLPRLPACQLCYQKKIKCDSTRPACTPCSRTGNDCIVLNSGGEETLSRAEIDRLEQRGKELSQTLHTFHVDEASTSNTTDQPTAEAGPTVNSIENSTVSHGEGLGFMASLFTDPDLRRNNIELLQLLARVPGAPEPAIQPCGLPSNEDGEFLFEKYLSWSHVQSPFLRRDEVKSLSGRVFLLVPADQPASNHDLFRAFMILAVGAVFPFKNGTHSQHPEGYYLAALQHMGSDFLTRGLASIQDLLLICRFGIYHRIGTSIWDVIRLCGRLCIEQGLHLNENPSSNFMQAQMERRVFWQFYMIDRYSSTLLGKPFGIDDRDIETSFPADANDEDLVTANQSSRDFAAFRLSHITLETTEMTVFFTSVRLRQISSRIHTEFSKLARNYFESSQSHFAPGYIYTTLSRLMQELQHWRDDSPVFQQPKCLYESQSWYDLLLAREELYLVRRAIDLVPKRDRKTPRHICILCLRTALRTIWIYSTLCQQRPLITHTRSYFHMMFTAGLSVLFCVSTATKLEKEDISDATAGLFQCEETLRDMAEQLPSARQYAAVFEALRRDTTRKLNKILDTLQSDNASQNIGPDNVTPAFRPSSLDRPSNALRVPDYLILGSRGSSQSNILGANLDARLQEDNFGGSITNNVAFSFPMERVVPGDTAISLSSVRDSQAALGVSDDFSPRSDLFDWAFLNDETLWNMESVLGEYVYGDPDRHIGALDAFDFQ